MLSYQHAYHAGSLADIHKHGLLAKVLDVLTRKERAITYMETHAGRGVYDLKSAEALKTGEAASGWLALEDVTTLPKSYVDAVKNLNGGNLAPLYPGSPAIVAHILRAQDSLHLMELHPQEHAALADFFRKDARVHVHKRDGLEGVLALSPPPARRGLVLIDPSYEIKTEYDDIPDFVVKLARKWPEAAILVWIPMLPAGKHREMLEKMKTAFPALNINQSEWPRPERGMFGSVMAGVNLPYGI